VSAIIVNYEGEPFIADCLTSVQQQSHPFSEVILVDNASDDRSLDIVRSQFPGVKTLELNENAGYPGACNLGFEQASGDLIAILNNDLVLDRYWLEALLKRVQQPWNFWACKIVFAANPSLIDSAGDGMSVIGAGYKIGHGEPAERHQRQVEVFGACGAAALYRRSLLVDLVGFDRDFFLIHEDSDLNLRARLRGHRCLYVPDAIVHHQVNASIRTFSHNYVFFGHRNSEFVFWQNMPWPLLLLYLPERLLFDLAAGLYFTLRLRGGSYLRAKWDFAGNLPQVLKKRRRVQAGRRLQTRQLRQLLDRNWLRHRRPVLVKP
jgi:GT2 family glycosyltransferase